jgi:hypothetical protein
MEYNIEALKGLLIFKNHESNKTFKAFKAYAAELNKKEQNNIIKLEKDKQSEYCFEYSYLNDTIYTVLFKSTEQEETYYQTSKSFSANVAISFLPVPLIHISYFESNRNNDNKKLKKIKEKREDDFQDFDYYYNLAKSDIEFVTDLQPKITEQINSLPEEWRYIVFDIEYKGTIIKINIPKLPFIFYSLNQRYAGDTLNDYNIPNWNCVAQSGWKCDGDNPYHTDFWTGLGFTPLTAYPTEIFEDDNFYSAVLEQIHDLKYEIQNKYWNFSSNSVGAKTFVQGNVLHYDKFKNDFSVIKPDDILILPNLNVEFELAIFAAIKNGKGGVISEVGGKLTHIAIVGREREFPVFIEKNALKKYRWIRKASLNGENGTIKVVPH